MPCPPGSHLVSSALPTGPNQLKIGSDMSGFVWLLIGIFFPISWPVSKALDHFLGDDHGQAKRYTRTELSALVEIHSRHTNHHLLQQQASARTVGEGMPSPSLPRLQRPDGSFVSGSAHEFFAGAQSSLLVLGGGRGIGGWD